MAVSELMRVGRFPAQWVWLTTDDPDEVKEPTTGVIPGGVRLDHGDHTVLVAWCPVTIAGTPVVPFTLECLVPLTIVEPIPCPQCGITGRIESGRWMASEGGQGG